MTMTAGEEVAEVVVAVEGGGGKPAPASRLSALQLILVNAVVCGVEFAACAGFSYIPPMLLKAGIPERYTSVILGIGPLLGLFIAPIIGRVSDSCSSKYGRRRPFIFALSLLCIVSLFMIPYGQVVGTRLFGETQAGQHVSVLLLALGTILLDFSTQTCLTPCEALLSDLCRGADHHRAFTYYSLMCSLGGCIGYLVAAIDWSSGPVGIYFGGQERAAFSLLIGLFTFSMISTLAVADEPPLIQDTSPALLGESGADGVNAPGSPLDLGYESEGEGVLPLVGSPEKGVEKTPGGGSFSRLRQRLQVHISSDLTLPRLLFRPLSALVALVCRPAVRWLVPSWCRRAITAVPLVLRRLATANFFSWSAVMCFNIFYTDFVGQAVFKGDPNAPDGSPSRIRFDEGVRYGSWGLLLHCLVAAVYAPFLERLGQKFGQRSTYIFGMSSFAVSLLLMGLHPTKLWCNAMAGLTGFSYATLTSIPFTLVNIYHEEKEFFYFDSTEADVSTRGIGKDVGILDTAYFGSQIALLVCMGYIVDVTGTTATYMVAAGLIGLVACVCATQIVYSHAQIRVQVRREKRLRNARSANNYSSHVS